MPQRIEVPTELTEPVATPAWPDRPLLNGDLSDWIKKEQARIEDVNERLEQIRGLTHGGEE